MSVIVKTTGGGGNNVTIDGVEVNKDVKLERKTSQYYSSDLPLELIYSAVVYKNQMHIFGRQQISKSEVCHYKLSGNSWIKASTLSLASNTTHMCATVVFNNELYFGSSFVSSGYTYVRLDKWNESAWTHLGSVRAGTMGWMMVVFKNEIHTMNGTALYKWNGETWVTAAPLIPISSTHYSFTGRSLFVFNNEIHIVGNGIYSSSGSYTRKHYKWNGDSWIEASTLPCDFKDGGSVVFNNEIHLLGSFHSGITRKHYKWNGNAWTDAGKLCKVPESYKSADNVSYPYNNPVIVFNREIHMFNSGTEDYLRSHCVLSDNFLKEIPQ